MKTALKYFYSFITNRFFLLLIILLGLFYLLFLELYDLQIIQGEALNEAFSLRVIRDRKIEGQRGTIYDRNGYPLAENILAYTVQLDGSIYVEDKNQMILELYNSIENHGDQVIKGFPIGIDINNNLEYQVSTLEIADFKRQVFNRGLSTALTDEQTNMTVNDMFNYVTEQVFRLDQTLYSTEEIIKILNIRYPLWLRRYYQYQLSTVAINISDKTLATLEENAWKFPGVTIIEDPLRQYNYPEYFAHIIGYTREISAEQLAELKSVGYDANDIVGVSGIEKVMELTLHGADGKETVEVDNLGRTMNILSKEDPSIGDDVYLTIDTNLQIASYDILEKQMANIIQSYLVYRKDEDSKDILMVDVFRSLVKNDIIDVLGIENAMIDTSEFVVNQVFQEAYVKTKQNLAAYLTLDSLELKADEKIYLDYFLETLVRYDYLTDGYDKLSAYDQFINNEISFKSMINRFLNSDYLTIYDDASYEDGTDYIIEKLSTEFTGYYAFKKLVLLSLVEDEAIDYDLLAMLLMEQSVTKYDLELMNGLKSGALDPLDYMKKIILELEITPKELALDPSSGAAVVVNVNNGEVLAMVSYPSYDNNYLVNGFDYSYYLTLLEDPTSPLFPRATHSKTAPGSTFKMVSAIAALENQIITTKEKISCLGIFKKIYPAAQCWIYASGGTHGPINVTKAIEVSCNYFFYEVGYRLSFNEAGEYVTSEGLNKLNATASLFGLDAMTGLEISEYNSNLSTVDPSRTAIGQAGNNYTPVQMARYIATLANGGTLYELSLIDKTMTPSGTVINDFQPEISNDHDFDADHLKVVHEGMLAVTEGGSGSARAYFYDFPIQVAGKTGTAQEAESRPNHSYFVAFAPYEQPEIAVVSIIHYGYASSKAIPVTRDIIATYYQFYDEKVDYSTDFMMIN